MDEVDSNVRSDVSREISEIVDGLEPDLRALSLEIHANPELAFEETFAAGRLTGELEAHGFQVQRGYPDLPTAFKASFVLDGEGGRAAGPTIAFIAEYDALPGIGHGCGHNLICTAAVGAAVALTRALKDRGVGGTVLVIGTPAEEGGGGKILLLERGAFEGVDAALMFHAGARTMTTRGSLAAGRVTMKFHGKAAHAAAAPEQGVNALDACIQTFNGINALRQHFKDETRIHGIITHGGDAPNIVPEYAEAKFSVRHRSFEYMREVKAKVFECARHAAASVGATVELIDGLEYAERRVNLAMAGRFRHHLESLGEPVKEPLKTGGVGSSDFGNLSQAVPAIHPYIQIVPERISAHTREFAEAAGGSAGMRALVLAAKCLALTGADLLLDSSLMNEVRSEFDTSGRGIEPVQLEKTEPIEREEGETEGLS